MLLLSWLGWTSGAWGGWERRLPNQVSLFRLCIPLFIDRPVAALQFVVVTDGDIYLVDDIGKEIICNEISPGVKRVVIWSESMSEFSGYFADVTDEIIGIGNVAGGDIEGNEIMNIYIGY
jgi:hypothetical protein